MKDYDWISDGILFYAWRKRSADIISAVSTGPACWDQTWGTTPGSPTPGPLRTSLTAKNLSTAALANWTLTDITTVSTLPLWPSGEMTHLSSTEWIMSLFSSWHRELPESDGEAQHGVQRQPHLQHHQHHRWGRPAGVLRHLLQCVLHPGPGPVQQQPRTGKRWPGGAGAGPGPVDHPVWTVWVWVRQAPVHQEGQRWGFSASVIYFDFVRRPQNAEDGPRNK